MTMSNLPPLVTVFGGSGFVGRHVVRALAKRGYRIRVAVRRPDLAGFLRPAGYAGQIQLVQANLRYRASIDQAVAGSTHVINCVGILFESGKNSFDAVQEFGAKAVAEAARAAGAKLTHVSAIGADAKSASTYGRSKGRAEDAILSILPDAVILRPSIVFGREDNFFNKFGDMARTLPFLPLIGGGKTKFQPVFVEDLAEAVALSFGIASFIGSIASKIPLITPPLTSDQVTLLKNDNVVSGAAEQEGRTLKGLGIAPTLLSSILPSYLVQYRVQGQFTGSGKAA
jgi:uncharacterized protein YbjT (DUF2867 family)